MKLFIVGNICSGKTTLGNTISNTYHVPLFSLDEIVHDDKNNTKRSNKEQINIINGIVRDNSDWIIEGVPRDNLDILCNLADYIIFIDINKKELFKRLDKRYKNKDKLNYNLDIELYNKMKVWIDSFDYDKIYSKFRSYPSKFIILKSNKEIDKYLLALEKSYMYM